jgi:hypothetical protein
MNSVVAGNADGADEGTLARDMIDVHGMGAASIARGNARSAALAGQRPQAKYWLRILDLIQRRRADEKLSISSATRG